MQTFLFDEFLTRAGIQTLAFKTILGVFPAPLKNGPWIAGSSLRNAVSGIDTEHYVLDYYFFNQAQLSDFLNKLKANTLNNYENYGGADNGSVVSCSLNLTDANKTKVYIRAHKDFCNTVEEVVAKSCFTLGQFVFDGANLYCGDYSLWDLAKNKLVASKITSGVAAVKELMEFSHSGYVVPDETVLDILRQVSANPALLR